MQTTNASIRKNVGRRAECIIVVNTEDANISHLHQIQIPIRTLEGLSFFFGISSSTAARQRLVDSGLF